MNVRRMALTGGVAVTLLLAGCATSVAGQGQVDPDAALSGTLEFNPTSALPDPGSSADDPGTAADPGTADNPGTADDPGTADEPSADATTDQQSADPTGTELVVPTHALPSISRPQPIPSPIPGLSAACNQVLAGVTAFSALLSGASTGSTDAVISQAKVDAALKSLPTSGLPARVQTDVNLLRATAKAAAGKTVMQLAMTLTDGKTLAALQDLSTWVSTNCA